MLSFFAANGLPKDRVVLAYKGEKEPADQNKTDAGKQRNRRVDFKFI
jgi:outer membrane protein OmpA-like peptidoglycan-associated protein